VVFQFYIALPIFVARQLVRHRMATLNEFSLRYSNPKDQCHVPEPTDIRKQSKTNRQGTEGQVEEGVALEFCEVTQETFDEAYKRYERDIGNGIGREQARWNLPLSTMTFWSWKIDLHNLFRTLSLRMDEHAQKEIQDFGVALHELTKELAPWAFEAWQDYDQRRDALLLTGPEVEYITYFNQSGRGDEPIHLTTRVTMREQEEFVAKLRTLGFDVQAEGLEIWIEKEKARLKAEKNQK
jgi:thymidylate synthase (FAD)